MGVGDSGVGTGVVTGVVLRSNTIINYEDPGQPFLGTLQGIGCFDGMFAEWVVVNNVVITDHWHGITLSGATNCTIINNTVVDCNTEDPGPPWVRIGDHKDGTPSTGCIVRNNLSTAFNVSSVDVVQDHNITIDEYDTYFVNYEKRNLNLKAGCPAVDSGSADGAPPVDRQGMPRPQGPGIDVGAYEYSDIIPITTDISTPQNFFGIYNYPNPFTISTMIRFTIRSVSSYVLRVYNFQGQNVYSFKGRAKKSGGQSIQWTGVDMYGKKVPAGLYLFHLQVEGCTLTGHMLVMR